MFTWKNEVFAPDEDTEVEVTFRAHVARHFGDGHASGLDGDPARSSGAAFDAGG